ncbi:MAG: hypothetical protein K2J71_02030 [Oscillospiraceae bacterium]|nr:hypothetical protein [Oscillospiraceae bacterium]
MRLKLWSLQRTSQKVKTKSKALWSRLTSDTAFRLLVTASFSTGCNFLYGLFYAVLGVIYQSPWHITLFVYYILLALMRFSVISAQNNPNKNYMKHHAVAMVFLAIAMSGIVCLSIAENRTVVYHSIIIITIATYTFYQTTISMINIIKAHKIKNPKLIILRNISVASCVGSMFSLECSMLGTFGDIRTSFARTMEIISGAFAVGIILFLGFSVIKFKKSKKDGETVE